MKVILKSRIRTLGEVGDIKIVADGYGKNYLLPRRLAIIYSEENYKVFEEQKKMMEIEDLANKKAAEELRNKIEKMDLVILEGAGDNDRLYGSVSTSKLARVINDFVGEKKLISRGNIIIKEPIKTLGKFQVLFDLHSDVSFEKDVIVARSREEAEKIKRGEFLRKDEKKALEEAKRIAEETEKALAMTKKNTDAAATAAEENAGESVKNGSDNTTDGVKESKIEKISE